MAKIVGAFIMPHVPVILAAPDAPERSVAMAVKDSFAQISRRLAELQVDTVVIIGADHYGLFGPHCVPQCLIGIGGVDGPDEDWLGLDRYALDTNEPLAQQILEVGRQDGIDWAISTSMTADHSIVIPHHLCVRSLPGVRTIPVYLNQVVQPTIPSERAIAIGKSMRRAIDDWSGSERVVIFGTGGVSHWVGGADMGRINEEFDLRVLSMLEAGDVDGLAQLTSQQILLEGGNGAMEIRNWLCALATVPEATPHVISYQAVPQWVTGMAFAELRVVA